jgi:hypothetical protein
MTVSRKLSRHLLRFSAAAAVALAAAACTMTSQLAPGDPVPYPDGYRHWTHVKSMVIEPGHALHASFGGIHHVYANDAAVAALRAGDGRYPDGAVFAFDLLEAERGGNAVTEGQRKVLGVMHRDARAFAETGGWGFAGFGGDGRANVVDDPKSACFACHQPQEGAGYVFSEWRQ